MKMVFEKTWVQEDGTKCTLTVESNGPISEENRAFISRFLPLAAGKMLDEVEALGTKEEKDE